MPAVAHARAKSGSGAVSGGRGSNPRPQAWEARSHISDMACKARIFRPPTESLYCTGTAKPCRSGRLRRGRVHSRLSALCARRPTAEPAEEETLDSLAGPWRWGSVTPNDPHDAATVSDADPIAPTRPYFSTRRPAAPSNPDLGECVRSPRRPLDHEAGRGRARCPRAYAAAISVLRAAGVPQTSRRPLSGSSERTDRLLAGERSQPQGWVRRTARRSDSDFSGERASAAPTPVVLQQAASPGHTGYWRLRLVDREAAGPAKAALMIAPILTLG